MRFIIRSLCFWASIVESLPSLQTQQRGQKNDVGTFQDPGAARRPRYRYWLPDASVDPQLLADDIVQLAARGAGGIEFLSYFNNGGQAGSAATDWNIYGYATPAYREILKAALQTHKEHGLLMDFAMGPQSSPGVPAEPDNPGLAWELVSFNTTIPENGTYTGQVPGWGEGDLVSAVTFALLNSSDLTLVGSSVVGEGSSYTITEYTVSSESLTEVTSSIQSDGTIAVTVSPCDGATAYHLYASYARRSYARSCIASSDDPQNILQNGSFAVDHFSATGAQVITSFLEEYILIDGIKELMEETGHYFWEDSVEIGSSVYWTPQLPEIFEEQHGYSMTKYLLLLDDDEGDQASQEGPVRFITDAADQGSGFVADFRSTLTQQLTAYLSYLNNWTHSALGLNFSQQVGYNLPVDMLAAIPSVDAPETETLSFINRIDGFRQFAGPANLAGKSVISIELGADFGQAYYQNWTSLLQEAKHSFVAGVNQVVLHGAPYSHSYPNTTWPGFTSFQYLFAGQHSRHQPAWNTGYAQAGNFLARTQFILQMGTPRVDLVFWDKQTAQNANPGVLYEASDLIEAGYSYQYLSPENFALPAAEVRDGVFAPMQQAFRALILRGNDTLTPEGVEALLGFARAGLPVLVSGGVPGTWASGNEEAIARAEKALGEMIELKNVHLLPYEGLAEVVRGLGVAPRADIEGNGTWYTRWKETEEGDVYVFVYNDGNYSEGTVAFETSGTPYFLNAWTGEQTAVIEYSVSNGRTVIPFRLQSTETRIVMFAVSGHSTTGGVHVVSSSPAVLGYSVDETSSKIWAEVAADDSAAHVTLSSGKGLTLQASPPQSFSLANWTVTIEQWLPPNNLFDVETVANKSNTTFSVPGPSLSSWTALGLPNASGVGYYATSFSWPDSRIGGYLVIPPVTHGLVVIVNGREIPAVDIANPVVDVSAYLVGGENIVVLRTASTLWNCLIPIWEELLTGGTGPTSSIAEIEQLGYGPQEYGVLGEVRVVPYQLVEVA